MSLLDQMLLKAGCTKDPVLFLLVLLFVAICSLDGILFVGSNFPFQQTILYFLVLLTSLASTIETSKRQVFVLIQIPTRFFCFRSSLPQNLPKQLFFLFVFPLKPPSKPLKLLQSTSEPLRSPRRFAQR